MPVRRIESGRAECDEVAGFTEYLARNQGQDGIAAKLSVTSPHFYVHRIERISIPPSLTAGEQTTRVIILPHRTRAQSGTMSG
jgi:hypothetical protein